MPAANLICPHCEKPVELHVTAVTRSRPCSNCGKPIILQFTQKQGRMKRKALLVSADGGLDFDAIKSDLGADEPQPLLGDAFERMKADPQLVAMKKRLAWAIGSVAATIVVASFIHLNRERFFPGDADKTRPELVSESVPSISSAPVRKESHIASAVRPEKRPDSLDFIPPPAERQIASKTNTAANVLQNTSPGAVPKLGAKTPIPDGGRSQQLAPVAKPPRSSASVGTSIPRALYRVPVSNPANMVAHDVDKARATLTSYMRSTTVEQRLAYIANSAQLEHRVRYYYRANGDGPVSFVKITRSDVIGNGSVSEHDIQLSNNRAHRAAVIVMPDGSYKVDWPSFVLENEMAWTDFVSMKPTSPKLFRVMAEAGDVFEADFNDAKWLLCVKLRQPSQPEAEPLYAYAERQSALGREIEYWLKNSEQPATPLTVRLRYPPDATAPNQVWLTDLVASGWVVSESKTVVEASRTGGGLISK